MTHEKHLCKGVYSIPLVVIHKMIISSLTKYYSTIIKSYLEYTLHTVVVIMCNHNTANLSLLSMERNTNTLFF